MDLITPDLGLVFWTGLTFIILMFILTKFIWKPIMAAVNNRENNIQEALDMAKKTKAEMEKLQTQNANLLKEARIERDEMIKEAKITSDSMIDSAKSKAQIEADKIVENARVSIQAEKNAAVAELKNQVATIALEIAEKILRQELSTDEKQKQLAESFAKDINLN
ncbi:F0F1 ATP synthase subunit B [Brumimicrobium glaciale]|jgi:F-type H+-transporting ATPase subunit b|uniref:ATP synthase subunit b n=1 Tax=Brumimicrobium glaciale TaxID=200475 RepID=A0A4Q4KKR4_9FLAO|nr:F0F1 ATP synthase subunit B [Brumimicrobium glaciale]RYM33963.1 F0F1 ATP synthase subunit B [Brumimicrobium glaciale]